MTGGFSGIAGMNPWSGFKYGPQDPYDERLNWSSTIASEQHMNSYKVFPTLDHWNGDWVQGRQEQKVYNSNDDDGAPKELQYYISEGKELATGYVRNRSYNVWTNRISNACESLENTDGFKAPLSNFYLFDWQTGPHNLFVYPLEKKTYYTIRWYDFLTGTEFFNQTYQSKGDGRFRLEYPLLHFATRPILWFSIEKASGSRFISDEQENEFGSDIITTKIYPNPFKDGFTFVSETEDEVEIINSLGSRIGSYSVNEGETRINLKSCSSGIYYVRSKSTSEVFKIVKL